MGEQRHRWSVRIFGAVFIGLLLVVALLTAAELVLRLQERGDEDPPDLPVAWGEGHLQVTPNNRKDLLEEYKDASGRLMVRTSRRMVQGHFMHDLSFPAQPEFGMIRVFCFGGSVTLGVPFERAPGLPFPDRLERHLVDAGVKAEVYNLGGASFGSEQVVMLARQAVRYGPAALVIYSGNNEFFNYDLELVNQNREWGRSKRSSLRVVRWLRTLLGGDGIGYDRPEEMVDYQERLVAMVMRRTLEDLGDVPHPVRHGGEALRRADRHYSTVVERYSRNLEEIRSFVGEASPRPLLLVSEVLTNLLHEPKLALEDPGLGEDASERWQALMDQGEELSDEGRHEAAARAFGEAARIDPVHAMGHYRLGLALLASGDQPGALVALSNALETDMNPGRPVAALNQAVRDLADGGLVIRVDPAPVFGLDEDPGAAESLFHDACHLEEHGYDQLGRLFADTLLANLQ